MHRIKLKPILFVVCIALGTACLFWFTLSKYEPTFKNHVLILTRFHPHIISDSVYQRVERTKMFLDSLHRFDTAKFKAILLARPGLSEHIQLLEHIYQLQNK